VERFIMNDPPLIRSGSGMAGVNEGLHTCTCHSHVHQQVKHCNKPHLTGSNRGISLPFGQYSFPFPLRIGAESGRLMWLRYGGGMPGQPTQYALKSAYNDTGRPYNDDVGVGVGVVECGLKLAQRRTTSLIRPSAKKLHIFSRSSYRCEARLK